MSERPVALVTGASRGIGAATCVELARRGYNITLVARTASDLENVAGQVKDAGGEALIRCGDISDLAFDEAAIKDTAKHFGRFDALISNAAWRDVITMRSITLESWEKTLRICVTAPAFMARWAAVHMEKQGKGAIINVSSVQSERASGTAPAYIAAKGALDALTYELATLYGPKGIRVVALNPGAIDTEMSGDYEAADGDNLAADLRAHSLDVIPLHRWGEADEMAKTIAFLISDDAAYITGTTILADGGLKTQLWPYAFKKRMFPEDY